jgi:hypothetical protein
MGTTVVKLIKRHACTNAYRRNNAILGHLQMMQISSVAAMHHIILATLEKYSICPNYRSFWLAYILLYLYVCIDAWEKL